jgi:tetratricopeptide (TPR) repeat protein
MADIQLAPRGIDILGQVAKAEQIRGARLGQQLGQRRQALAEQQFAAQAPLRALEIEKETQALQSAANQELRREQKEARDRAQDTLLIAWANEDMEQFESAKQAYEQTIGMQFRPDADPKEIVTRIKTGESAKTPRERELNANRFIERLLMPKQAIEEQAEARRFTEEERQAGITATRELGEQKAELKQKAEFQRTQQEEEIKELRETLKKIPDDILSPGQKAIIGLNLPATVKEAALRDTTVAPTVRDVLTGKIDPETGLQIKETRQLIVNEQGLFESVPIGERAVEGVQPAAQAETPEQTAEKQQTRQSNISTLLRTVPIGDTKEAITILDQVEAANAGIFNKELSEEDAKAIEQHLKQRIKPKKESPRAGSQALQRQVEAKTARFEELGGLKKLGTPKGFPVTFRKLTTAEKKKSAKRAADLIQKAATGKALTEEEKKKIADILNELEESK